MSIHIDIRDGSDTFQYDWIQPGRDEGVLAFYEPHYDGETGVLVAELTATEPEEIAAIEAVLTGVYPYGTPELADFPPFVREAVEAAQ